MTGKVARNGTDGRFYGAGIKVARADRKRGRGYFFKIFC